MNGLLPFNRVFHIAPGGYRRSMRIVRSRQVRSEFFPQRDIAWEVGTQQRSNWHLNRTRIIRNDLRAERARGARHVAAACARHEAMRRIPDKRCHPSIKEALKAPAYRRCQCDAHTGFLRMPAGRHRLPAQRRTRYFQPIQAPLGG
jgi:hypothetical protein